MFLSVDTLLILVIIIGENRSLSREIVMRSYTEGATLKNHTDKKLVEKLLHYLVETFPRLEFRPWVPLREILPEPDKKYLKSIWRYGHGDICVFRHGEPVCIIEPGGYQHTKNETQKRRDKRKDRLCKLNEVSVLRLYNDTIYRFLDPQKSPHDLRILKKLFRKYIYSAF